MRHKHSETREREAAGEAVGRTPRTDHLDYARLLGQVDLFTGLERVTLSKLAAHLEPLSYPSGSIIFRQAEPADAFYLVARGTVGVYVTGNSGTAETPVKILHVGAPFGEMALLTNSARAATIKVETDCEVLRLDRTSFLDLVQEHPGVALSIAATLSRRLAAAPDQQDEFYAPALTDSPSQAGGGTATLARSRWRPGRRGLALLTALVILPLGWILEPPAGLSVSAWHALAVLLAALPALALEALLESVVALLITSAWVGFGITAPGIALSGFASPNWVFVVAALIIAAAISSTGLLYRFALESIVRIRGGFASEVMALSLAGLLMGPAVPNTTGRVIMIAPMLQDLVEALGYRPQSKPAAGLAMAALVGFGQMAAMFLTSSATAVMVLAVMPAPAREDVNWITWVLYAAPANVVLFAGLLAFILWLYRPAERLPSGKRAGSLALQRALLGPISREEKIALGFGFGLIVGCMTEPFHRVDLPWIAVLAMAVLTASGLVNVNTLRSVNWNFALLYGVLISLATVFGQTRLDRWIADRITATDGDLLASPAMFVISLVVLCFAISLFIRWQAAAPLITIALASVASASGVRRGPGCRHRLQYLLPSVSKHFLYRALRRHRWQTLYAPPDHPNGDRLCRLDDGRDYCQPAGVEIDGPDIAPS